MAPVRTAAVIGGGIAGPVVALALQKAGIEATVYEAHPKTADGIGGTLALAPNGLAALAIVGAAAAVSAVAQPIPRTVLTIGSDKRFELPTLPDVGPLRMVRRDDLYRILHAKLVENGIPIGYDKRLTDASQTARSASVEFADGSHAQADVVVGADGVHSLLRRLIDPKAPGPAYTGMLGFEGLSSSVAQIEPDTTTFAFGKRGYYLYWRAPRGGVTWGVNLPYERPLTLTEARELPAQHWLRTLRNIYGQDIPGADLIEHTAPDALQVNGASHIMPSVPHWYQGRMVLVGDAVHAPSNSSGQGASLAIESAIQLARCLRDVSDISAAFATYERLRRPRVERIAANAAKVNQVKAPGRFLQAAMPIVMPLFIKVAMKPEKMLGPVQRYRIDWDKPVATESLLR